jgi:hypothetical protein
MKAVYCGEQNDIGRFGTVKRGDVLTLSDKEWESVKDNGLWLEADSDEGKKIKPAKLELTDEQEQQCLQWANALPVEEQRRLSQMTQADQKSERDALVKKRLDERRKKMIREIEQQREEELDRQNDPSRVLAENLSGMNREELMRTAQTLRDQGKEISFTADASVKALRRAIKAAIGVDLTDEDQGD